MTVSGKGEIRLDSKRGTVAVRLLDILYNDDQSMDGGQARALAELAEAQRAGQARAPSPLFNLSRDIFSRNTQFSRGLYQRLRKQGMDASIPSFEITQPLKSLKGSLRARWGEAFADVYSTLAMLREQAKPNLSGGSLAQWVVKDHQSSEADWRRQNSFGLVVDAYLADIIALHRLLVQRDREKEAASLLSSMIDVVHDFASDKLKTISADRGLLICGTHAGPFRYGYYILAQLFPGMLVLDGKGDSSKGNVATDPVRALYSMTKELKKPGAVGLIGADGPEGVSTGSAPVRSLEVLVRMGAPTLVYNARCANAFFLSRWTDQGLVFECTESPAIAPGGTFKEWSKEWLTAYGAVMSDLVDGDPANVQGSWGMWRAIRGAIDDSEQSSEALNNVS